jgi:two-component system chemotaxis response regulator CheB
VANTKDEVIRMLVVDDSAFMRKALTMMLESDPGIKVIGTARDGQEGIEKVRLLKPDLVTLDIEMPRMDGLTALREIMDKTPVPVMMVSSISTEGAQATLDALELGAVDFIPKQMSYVSLDIVKIQAELIAKIKNIARRRHHLMARFRQRRFARIGQGQTSAAPQATSTMVSYHPGKPVRKHSHNVSIIAIGTSTGGPPALQAVVPRLPRNLPVGVIVAQHMPPAFTKSLAERLDGMSQVTVREAADGDKIEPGLVLVAPGGRHLTVRKRGAVSYAVVSDQPSDTLYKPCVDVMMNSVAKEHGRSSLGVIMTGMGNNGVVGIRSVKQQGGVVIAQDEASCIVYGMPRAIIEAKLADHVTSLDDIVGEIVSYF